MSRQVLLTKQIRRDLPALYSQENSGISFCDRMVIAKWFAGSWTWYALEGSPVPDNELDPEFCESVDEFEFYGIVDGIFAETGSFLLSQLRATVPVARDIESGRVLRLPIERDIYWKPVPVKELRFSGQLTSGFSSIVTEEESP